MVISLSFCDRIQGHFIYSVAGVGLPKNRLNCSELSKGAAAAARSPPAVNTGNIVKWSMLEGCRLAGTSLENGYVCIFHRKMRHITIPNLTPAPRLDSSVKPCL